MFADRSPEGLVTNLNLGGGHLNLQDSVCREHVFNCYCEFKRHGIHDRTYRSGLCLFFSSRKDVQTLAVHHSIHASSTTLQRSQLARCSKFTNLDQYHAIKPVECTFCEVYSSGVSNNDCSYDLGLALKTVTERCLPINSN